MKRQGHPRAVQRAPNTDLLVRQEVRKRVESWLDQIEANNKNAARLLTIAQYAAQTRENAASQLVDVEQISDRLALLGQDFERQSATWPDHLQGHGRVTDLRKSIAAARGILARARLLLEERTNPGLRRAEERPSNPK